MLLFPFRVIFIGALHLKKKLKKNFNLYNNALKIFSSLRNGKINIERKLGKAHTIRGLQLFFYRILTSVFNEQK